MDTTSHPSVGIYIHIPWCRSICTYCDFDRQAHAFDLIPAYVEALVADIARQPAVRAHSIFFGGGTPSLLEPAQIAAVLNACRQHFNLLPDSEITVEANPGDLDATLTAGYIAAGVNRFSLGVQTLDDPLLRLLGRRHQPEPRPDVRPPRPDTRALARDAPARDRPGTRPHLGLPAHD